MKLQKLTQTNFQEIKEKKICCIEKSLLYLDELCDFYEILGQMVCIVDDNTKNQGKFLYRDRELSVQGFNYLKEINFENTVLLILSDYYIEVFEQLSTMEFGEENKNMQVYFFANMETEYELTYRKSYEDSELENIIVFRSGPHPSAYVKGMDFTDNAKALFEYLLENEYNKKYELIWLVKNPKELSQYSEYSNVSFLSYEGSISSNKQERDLYYRALCLAKFIFFTDAYGFARNCRKDQVRVQLWHGCGFKTRLNFARCEQRYEYTTVTSELYANIHAQIFGLRKEQVLITGCAKEDWLFRPKENWKKILSIPEAKKYIFWLPTYRFSAEKFSKPRDGFLNEDTGLPLMDSALKLEKMNYFLSENDTVLIIKLHPFQDKEAVCSMGYSNIIMIDNEYLYENGIEINQLLGHADALISDYSSVAVDYMLLDKPMAFSLDDLEEYESSRGFVFDNISQWLPGKVLFSFEDICDFINEVVKNNDVEREKRKKLLQLMHQYRDGNNSRRIAEAVGILLDD